MTAPSQEPPLDRRPNGMDSAVLEEDWERGTTRGARSERWHREPQRRPRRSRRNHSTTPDMMITASHRLRLIRKFLTSYLLARATGNVPVDVNDGLVRVLVEEHVDVFARW